MLDRIDIHIEVPAVKYKEPRGEAATEDSAAVRERVVREKVPTREIRSGKMYLRERPDGAEIDTQTPRFPGTKLLETAVMRLGLSARAHDRILKVARTIADLKSAADIASRHLSEAIRYRTLDRTYWA